MLWPISILGAIALFVVAKAATLPTYQDRSQASTGDKLVVREARAFRRAPTVLETAQNVLPLRRTTRAAKSSLALRATVNKTAPLIPNQALNAYSIDVVVDGQTYLVDFDTGSSDLWLASQGFQCIEPEIGDPVPAYMYCPFGPLAPATFPGGNITDENFFVSYGDGTLASGVLGFSDVCIAGIAVEHQEMALVNRAFWFNGDNVTSGLMGFAYPSLTNAFNGTDPTLDDPTENNLPYTPWLFNAIDQGIIEPVFSIALKRGNSTGSQLALGGLPTVDFEHNFTSTPMQIVETVYTQNTNNYSFYAIMPDGFLLQGAGEPETFYAWNQSNASTEERSPIVVDSGTTLTDLPFYLAAQINSLFQPPAEYSILGYTVFCNATAPKVAVRIGGTDFFFDSRDLILDFGDPSGICGSGIGDGGAGGSVLGDTFLRSVVAVFDVGEAQMRFAPHND